MTDVSTYTVNPIPPSVGLCEGILRVFHLTLRFLTEQQFAEEGGGECKRLGERDRRRERSRPSQVS